MKTSGVKMNLRLTHGLITSVLLLSCSDNPSAPGRDLGSSVTYAKVDYAPTNKIVEIAASGSVAIRTVPLGSDENLLVVRGSLTKAEFTSIQQLLKDVDKLEACYCVELPDFDISTERVVVSGHVEKDVRTYGIPHADLPGTLADLIETMRDVQSRIEDSQR